MIRPYIVALFAGLLAGCAVAGQATAPKAPELILTPTAGQRISEHAAQHLTRALAAQAGTLYTWGDNDAGQLGVGTISDAGNHFDQDAATPEPALLPAGTQVASMAAGLSDTAVATTTGAVYVTGYNQHGQLGDGVEGASTGVTSPVQASIPGGVSIATVAMGHDQALALSTGGTLYSWGQNDHGQAGIGSKKSGGISTPTIVDLPAGTIITAIGTGSDHDLAVTSAGSIFAWGLNTSGQLGDNQTTNSSLPVSVALPSSENAVAVAGGEGHSVALASDGTVWAWGLNSHGQLGNGSTTESNVPAQVQLPGGAVIQAVAAGENYSLALGSDGTIYAWGDNVSGNLGNGTTVDSDVPVVVRVPAGVIPVEIAAGGNRCHLLSSSGQIYDWGSAENGKDIHLTPVLDAVPPGETPVAIADGVEAEQYLAAMVPTGATSIAPSARF